VQLDFKGLRPALKIRWLPVHHDPLIYESVSQRCVAAQTIFFTPYNVSAAGVGCLFVGSFHGEVLGSAALAIVIDPLI